MKTEIRKILPLLGCLLTCFGMQSSQLLGQHLFFAWLTDIHVGSENCLTDLDTVLADIERNDSIAFVIVSGDITEMDVGSNLELAKASLEKLTVPYYIIPGNHDTKWSDSGGQRFNRLWGKSRFCFNAGGLTFIGFSQGPVLRMADGLISPQDSLWLDTLLTRSILPDQRLIFITHYPLDQQVSNYEIFYFLVDGYNVQALLNGHEHVNRVRAQFGLPAITSRATKSDRQNRAGYTLVELLNDTLKFYERVPQHNSLRLWHRQLLIDRPFKFVPPDSLLAEKAQSWNKCWEFKTGNLVTASPVSDGRALFIGDAGGNLYAIDARTGRLQWQRQLGAPLLATAAVADRYLVIGSTDSNVYCFNKNSGQIKWRVKTDAPVLAVPTITGNIVYIGSSDRTFRAIDLKSGKIIWAQRAIEGFVESRPLVTDHLVIFGTWANRLYALERGSGDLVWCWQDGTPGELFSPAACYPVQSANQVFIVAPDRYMTAIDVNTGKTLWRSNYHKVRESIGISDDHQLIYARCMRDTVFALIAAGENRHYLWEKPVGYGYDFAPAPIIESAGKLYFGTKSGELYCLAAQDGKLLNRIKLGKSLIHTVCPVGKMQIVVALMEGRIVCLKVP